MFRGFGTAGELDGSAGGRVCGRLRGSDARPHTWIVASTLPLRARRGSLLPSEVEAWAALRRQLRRGIDAPATALHFEIIRSRSATISRHATADCLLAYLAEDVGADLDTKSQLYADLVRCAQSGKSVAQLAYSLLWLGLWPGLSGAFVRRAAFWRDATSDLVAELSEVFTGVVARLNLDRVRCVIGTLVRSTEREVIRAGVARDRRSVIEISTAGPEALHRHVLAAPAGPDPERTLIAVAAAIKGREQDPAIQAAVCGLGPGHIALALGLKPAAARKRLERARRWLKTASVRAGRVPSRSHANGFEPS